jgi:hypothetical protein
MHYRVTHFVFMSKDNILQTAVESNFQSLEFARNGYIPRMLTRRRDYSWPCCPCSCARRTGQLISRVMRKARSKYFLLFAERFAPICLGGPGDAS